MADAYDRAAFLASFGATLDAHHADVAARNEEFNRQRQALRIATGHPLAKSPAAGVTPLAPPTPAPILPRSPADLEFERVRAAACARIAAEHEARRDDEAAAAAILEARRLFEPMEHIPSHVGRGSVNDETAVSLILSFIPNHRA